MRYSHLSDAHLKEAMKRIELGSHMTPMKNKTPEKCWNIKASDPPTYIE